MMPIPQFKCIRKVDSYWFVRSVFLFTEWSTNNNFALNGIWKYGCYIGHPWFTKRNIREELNRLESHLFLWSSFSHMFTDVHILFKDKNSTPEILRSKEKLPDVRRCCPCSYWESSKLLCIADSGVWMPPIDEFTHHLIIITGEGEITGISLG